MARGVDLTISNSIINSWLAGKQMARQQEQDAIAEQQRVAEQKRYDDEQKRLAEQDKQNQEQFKINKTASKIGVQEALQGIISKGGKPAGYEEMALPEVSPEIKGILQSIGVPTAPKVQAFNRTEENDLLPSRLTSPTPEYLQQQSLQNERAKGEMDLGFKNQASLFNAGLGLDETRLKAQLEEHQKEIDFKNDLELNRQKYNKELEVARVKLKLDGSDMSGSLKAVIDNPAILDDPKFITAKQRGDIIDEAGRHGIDIFTPLQKNAETINANALVQAQKIKDMQIPTGAVAKIESGIPITDAYYHAAEINKLKTLLTIPEFKYIQGLGAMSDLEFKSLQLAASAIDIGSPDFYKQLDDIISTLQTAQNKTGKPTPPKTPTGGKPDPASFDLTAPPVKGKVR